MLQRTLDRQGFLTNNNYYAAFQIERAFMVVMAAMKKPGTIPAAGARRE